MPQGNIDHVPFGFCLFTGEYFNYPIAVNTINVYIAICMEHL